MPSYYPNLPGMEIMAVEEGDHDIEVNIQRRHGLNVCPHCGAAQIVANGTKKQRIRDVPSERKRVHIVWYRQRFLCRQCGGTSYDQHPDFDPDRRMTKRLISFIGSSSLHRSFAQVAEAVGVDEKTVRLVWASWSERELSGSPRTPPRWLGIAGVHLLGKARVVFTDVVAGTVLDLVPDRSEATAAAWLEQLQSKETVKIVTVDLWRPYHAAVQATLPNALITVDRRQIQRLANIAMDDVVESLRSGLPPALRRQLNNDRPTLQLRRRDLAQDQAAALEDWKYRLPTLTTAYEMKEEFFDLWAADEGDDFIRRYADWQSRLPENLQGTFELLNDTMREWLPTILAGLSASDATAAQYARALREIKTIFNQFSRAQSYNVLRVKILLAQQGKIDGIGAAEGGAGIAPSALARLLADDPVG